VGESILMVPKLEKARRACLGGSVMMAGPGAEVLATGPYTTRRPGPSTRHSRADHSPEYVRNDPSLGC
jgi:hypothetical protein